MQLILLLMGLMVQVWVRDVHEAQELLDYKTGLRYNKAKVRL